MKCDFCDPPQGAFSGNIRQVRPEHLGHQETWDVLLSRRDLKGPQYNHILTAFIRLSTKPRLHSTYPMSAYSVVHYTPLYGSAFVFFASAYDTPSLGRFSPTTAHLDVVSTLFHSLRRSRPNTHGAMAPLPAMEEFLPAAEQTVRGLLAAAPSPAEDRLDPVVASLPLFETPTFISTGFVASSAKDVLQSFAFAGLPSAVTGLLALASLPVAAPGNPFPSEAAAAYKRSTIIFLPQVEALSLSERAQLARLRAATTLPSADLLASFREVTAPARGPQF